MSVSTRPRYSKPTRSQDGRRAMFPKRALAAAAPLSPVPDSGSVWQGETPASNNAANATTEAFIGGTSTRSFRAPGPEFAIPRSPAAPGTAIGVYRETGGPADRRGIAD